MTGAERSPLLPDVPSMAEAGFPSVDVHLWSGVFAPTGTPAPVVAKLRTALKQSIEDPGVSGKLKAMAVDPGGATPEEFEKLIQSDIVKFGEVVKAANLKFKDQGRSPAFCHRLVFRDKALTNVSDIVTWRQACFFERRHR